MATPQVIRIAAAFLFDEAGRMAFVRKRGTDLFMLPGGKIDAGETALAALRRELAEELALDASDPIAPLGRFAETAAHEPGARVDAEVFAVFAVPPNLTPQAEIAELRWMRPEAAGEHSLAPLLRSLLPLAARVSPS